MATHKSLISFHTSYVYHKSSLWIYTIQINWYFVFLNVRMQVPARRTKRSFSLCELWSLTSENLASSSWLRSSTCLSEFFTCSYILWACSARCLSFSSFISSVVMRLAADTASLLTDALLALSVPVSLADCKENPMFRARSKKDFSKIKLCFCIRSEL